MEFSLSIGGLLCVLLFISIKLFQIAFTKFRDNFFIRLINKITQDVDKHHGKLRRELFSDLGDLFTKRKLVVLEIGAGAGANFRYYPEGTSVIALEPKEVFKSYLLENADKFRHVQVSRFVVGVAEDMSEIGDQSVNAVVCTNVLCSVNDVGAALSEIRRVIKPGGKFYFHEHVRALNDRWMYLIQWLATPIFIIMGDNCHLTRVTWKSIESAGFSHVSYKYYVGPYNFFFYPTRPKIYGSAIK